MARRVDADEMPEAVLVKMKPGVWRAIRALQRAKWNQERERISPPEAIRMLVLAAYWRKNG